MDEPGHDTDQVVTVLFVEDDPDLAAMYKLKLETDGYEVMVATDGISGLLKARIAQPDLIFLDIGLPKLDGFRVLEMLRGEEVTKQIPVVILSNYSEDPMIRRGLQLGAKEYVIKAETTPTKLAESVGAWTTTG